MAGRRGPGGGWSYMGAGWPTLTDEQRQRVEANTGLVGFVLHRRRTTGDQWDDAWQNGMLGLMRAAQLFEPARGFRFSTYALNWIKACVVRGAGVEADSNLRRAHADGIDWNVVSIDAPTGELEHDLTHTLASTDDVEADAISLASEARLAAICGSLCRDDFDRALLVAVALGQPITDVSRAWDQLESNARVRIARIRAQLRHPVYRDLQRAIGAAA